MATIEEENLALVRRFMDAFNQRDPALLRQVTAPDHVEHPHWHDPLPLPGDDAQPILDRYEQADADTWADFRELRMAIDDQFSAGDRVVTIWTATGTLAGADRSAVIRGISIDRIADGQIAETWTSMDRLGMFQQLGVVARTRALADRAGLTI